MDKDTKRILEAAVDQGFEVRYPKNGHPTVYRDGRKVTSFAGTASDKRSFANSLAPLKRAGFIVPGSEHKKKKGER